ncbi:MAG: 4-alpha-glucanotransferase, partial [Acidobacteria bacterium]|nr:4-alpha-glucanotransferase [Acidobacteriota bacterium]
MSYGRSSGILMHVTSMPSRFGIGDMGEESERFLRWMESSGQRVWQILPLNPTNRGGSPYGALSAFAGNPWLIAPQRLLEQGLIGADDLPRKRKSPAVDFDAVAGERARMLRAAWRTARESEVLRGNVEAWSRRASQWIDDWALFAAIRQMHDDQSWSDWPEPLRHREPEALDRIRDEHDDDIGFHRFVQWLFHQQWHQLHQYANDRDIAVFGDAPIYVAWDSADVWANPDRFRLDENLQSTVVAGVPPDYFSETGQRWGNPIYDWNRMRKDGFWWWTERLRANLTMVDVLRLDHFRAFAGYW